MPEQVIKRDGRLEQWDEGKLTRAVSSILALEGISNPDITAETVVRNITARFNGDKRVHYSFVKMMLAEELQKLNPDAVERMTIHEVGKVMQHHRTESVQVEELMREYLDRVDWRINENANMEYSYQGLVLYLSGAMQSRHVLNTFGPEIRDAHELGFFHIHDLAFGFAAYCAGWSLRDLLLEGFNLKHFCSSAPANHLDTVMSQMVNFTGTLQNEFAGAMAFNNVDTYLAPFIRYDKLSYAQVKQILQRYIYNTNTTSRWGGQTPFSNITMDVTCPEHMRSEPVIYGGQFSETDTYGDFQAEMDIFNKAFIEVFTAGDSQGRIFSFPIPTYNITTDFPWESEVGRAIAEMTAKYGAPYFQNFINSDLDPKDIRSMCCRLSINLADVVKHTGGLFGNGDLTGSIGVVTLNLPKLAFLAGKGNRADFYKLLKRYCDLAKDSLELKRSIVNKNFERGLYPWARRYLKRGFKGHFSTIGVIGGHEACLNLLGVGIDTEEGHQFMLEVLSNLRSITQRYQEETGNLYNLEATPAEGACYRLAKVDRKLYGDQIIQSGNGEPYYTNSTQLPVSLEISPIEAVQAQADLQTQYSGGCIEKGNRVVTDKGTFKIEDLVQQFRYVSPIRALSYNPGTKAAEWDLITDAMSIDVSNKDKIRVQAEGGFNVVTSDWHPFFVVERTKFEGKCPVCGKEVSKFGMPSHLRYRPECRAKFDKLDGLGSFYVTEKRADELKPGDYILHNSDNMYPDTESEFDSELMYLFGYFVGDGSILKINSPAYTKNRKTTHYKVRFFGSTDDMSTMNKIKDILIRRFGAQSNVFKKDRRSNKCIEYQCGCSKLVEWLADLGFSNGNKMYTVGIPEKVKQNITKDNVYALLSGLADSDGHIDKRTGRLEISTVSRRLAEDIVEICSIAGIDVGCRERDAKRDNEVRSYGIQIPNLALVNIKDRLCIERNADRIKQNGKGTQSIRVQPMVRVLAVNKVDVGDNIFYDLTTEKNHNYLAGNNTMVFIHNTVLHTYLGDASASGVTVRDFIVKAFTLTKLPYLSITPTFSVCEDHGYFSGEHFQCPVCGRDAEVMTRIVGYYRPLKRFNKGKLAEYRERREFTL